MSEFERLCQEIDELIAEIELIAGTLTALKILSDIKDFENKEVVREAERIANEG